MSGSGLLHAKIAQKTAITMVRGSQRNRVTPALALRHVLHLKNRMIEVRNNLRLVFFHQADYLFAAFFLF